MVPGTCEMVLILCDSRTTSRSSIVMRRLLDPAVRQINCTEP